MEPATVALTMTKLERLDVWVWVLVYGGLLSACLAPFVWREPGGERSPIGHLLLVGGLAAAALGAVLLWVRARRTPPPAPPRPPVKRG